MTPRQEECFITDFIQYCQQRGNKKQINCHPLITEFPFSADSAPFYCNTQSPLGMPLLHMSILHLSQSHHLCYKNILLSL